GAAGTHLEGELLTRVGKGHVELDELGALSASTQPGGEVVDHDHLLLLLQEESHHVRPDVSGTTDHESRHGISLPAAGAAPPLCPGSAPGARDRAALVVPGRPLQPDHGTLADLLGAGRAGVAVGGADPGGAVVEQVLDPS